MYSLCYSATDIQLSLHDVWELTGDDVTFPQCQTRHSAKAVEWRRPDLDQLFDTDEIFTFVNFFDIYSVEDVCRYHWIVHVCQIDGRGKKKSVKISQQHNETNVSKVN